MAIWLTAARELARARWGNRVAENAAQVTIERHAELEPETRAAVRSAMDAAWDATAAPGQGGRDW